ncbi:hypothetical protein LCGC14_2302810 [marine sediment metagenome]|uniref:Uncharacterized protein n=1 Tax=marine sediment metagenome TaxID=412755 RepID=A0A0F9CMY2_9ZZZZ
MIITGIVGLIAGLVAGYLLGWRNGHLTGVEYALKIALAKDIPEDELAKYTQDVFKHVEKRMNYKSVKDQLAGDAAFQRQLAAQEDENGRLQ